SFPIVIQLGKWRRMVMVGPVTNCQNLYLTASQTRLPTRQNEGQNGVDNIPFIAVSTGEVDGLECVLYKLGIEELQFGNPPGTVNNNGTPSADRGRIRLYRDDNGRGARINNRTPDTQDRLTNSQANLDQYDAVVFGCSASAHT